MVRRFGLWPTHRHLVAVGLDARGSQGRPLWARRSEDARRAMLDFFASLVELEIVVAQSLLDSDLPLAVLAAVLRAPTRIVWVAPDPLAEAIAKAAGSARASPARLAAILARLPSIPRLRPELRRLSPPAVQLDLL